MSKSILFAGVGGQGILRASDIICEVIMGSRSGCQKSGNSTAWPARWMREPAMFVMERKSTRPGRDRKYPNAYLLRKMEALRYLKFIRKDAAIIVIREIYPPAVNMGDAPYPEDAIFFLNKLTGKL